MTSGEDPEGQSEPKERRDDGQPLIFPPTLLSYPNSLGKQPIMRNIS